jgi:hypothetical protein
VKARSIARNRQRAIEMQRSGVCHIDISHDLSVARTWFEHGGSLYERSESPVLALFSASADLIVESGLMPELFLVTFRGVNCRWRPESGVWPPTFDAYAIIAALADTWDPTHRTLWDLGCGTGVIGLHLLQLTRCEHATFTDRDVLAVADTRTNVSSPASMVDIRVEAFPDDVPPRPRSDVLVSNPPYFPRDFLGWKRFKYQATDDGDLTRAIVNFGRRHAKRVVLAVSSVALVKGEGSSALGRLVRNWHVLARWRLPLNVPGFYRSCELPAGVFRDGPDRKFTLWHDVFICEGWDEGTVAGSQQMIIPVSQRTWTT